MDEVVEFDNAVAWIVEVTERVSLEEFVVPGGTDLFGGDVEVL